MQEEEAIILLENKQGEKLHLSVCIDPTCNINPYNIVVFLPSTYKLGNKSLSI